jgi:hypothetical protein
MSDNQTESGAARAVADRMSDAAEAVLAGVSGPERSQLGWGWSESAERERRRWFYTPTDHGGLAVADMAPGQYQRTMALLATGLSEAAYATVTTIIGLENLLDRVEGFAGFSFARQRGRDPGQYRLRIFGIPGERTWGWRFGGHHVSLNNLVVDGELVSSTPCFLGADPATSPLLGTEALRPLGGVEDLGRALVRSLDDAQLAEAVLSPRAPTDIVTGNRTSVGVGDRVVPVGDLFRGRFADPEHARQMDAAHDAGERYYGITDADHQAVELTARPLGVPAAALDTDQRALLLALLDCYTGRVPEQLIEREAARYAGPLLDEVHFAWAGPLEPGSGEPGSAGPCYYRLQGPRLLVEYDNTQRQVNHAHSVWRDPEGDFGADALAAHRAAHHS